MFRCVDPGQPQPQRPAFDDRRRRVAVRHRRDHDVGRVAEPGRPWLHTGQGLAGPLRLAATCSAGRRAPRPPPVPDPSKSTFTAAPTCAGVPGAFHPLQLEPLPHCDRVAPCHIEASRYFAALGPVRSLRRPRSRSPRAGLVSHHRAGLASRPQRLGHPWCAAVVLGNPAFNIVFLLALWSGSHRVLRLQARRTASFAIYRGYASGLSSHWPPDAGATPVRAASSARARAAAFPARWTVAVRRARQTSRILRPPAGWSRLAATSARTSRTDLPAHPSTPAHSPLPTASAR